MDPSSSSDTPSTPLRSRFTYRNLSQLAKSSVDCPLRVVAHVDLDAFYAQCEMKRLGVPREEPLAVQQWANLIAVNYPARARGVTRHITAVEAKKLCPEIRLVHVAVWHAGSSQWCYTDDVPNMALAKSSLDPYRAESKKILSVFRSTCPDAILEKAGIDENFLDLSKPIYHRLLAENEVLRDPPPYNNSAEFLPLPEKRKVDWCGSHLVASANEDGEMGEVEEDEPLDWDDVALAIGADMVKKLREAVWGQLGYTCGGGISSNKMLAKLGSAFKKPNQQSVVRASAVQPFLDRHKYTKIRNFGGKLGTRIVNHINSEELTELYKLSLTELSTFLSDDTATWVYNTIRGIDRSSVTPRTAIKSMLSAKSFRPPALPASHAHAQQWLKVFVADIWARIEDEEAFSQTVRRPKVMSLNFLSKSGGNRSRQTAIGGGGFDAMMKTAEGLLRWVLEEGGNGGRGTWPCVRMTLDVSGFEERETRCGDIGNFFTRARSGEVPEDGRPAKRVKTASPPEEVVDRENGVSPTSDDAVSDISPPPPPPEPTLKDGEIRCDECGAPIPIQEVEEHRDWHIAKEMEKQWQREETAVARPPPPPPPPPPQKPQLKGKKLSGKAGNRGREKGQTVLKF